MLPADGLPECAHGTPRLPLTHSAFQLRLLCSTSPQGRVHTSLTLSSRTQLERNPGPGEIQPPRGSSCGSQSSTNVGGIHKRKLRNRPPQVGLKRPLIFSALGCWLGVYSRTSCAASPAPAGAEKPPLPGPSPQAGRPTFPPSSFGAFHQHQLPQSRKHSPQQGQQLSLGPKGVRVGREETGGHFPRGGPDHGGGSPAR